MHDRTEAPRHRIPLFVAALVAGQAVAAPAGQASAELREAISIADAFLPSLSVKPAEYKLVATQNVMNGAEYKGPAFWRLTYKTCGGRLATAEPICKGGELFIGVDMKKHTASFLGTGE